MKKLLTTLSILLIATAGYADNNRPAGETTGIIYRPVGDATYTERKDKLRKKLERLLDEAQNCEIDADCVILRGGGRCFTAVNKNVDLKELKTIQDELSQGVLYKPCPMWKYYVGVCEENKCVKEEIAELSLSETYTVERVVDGITLELTYGEKVTLIGLKKPDDEIMGQEATEFVKELIKPGQEVRLELDVQERDEYWRLLAYVYQQPDGLKELKAKEIGLYAIREPFLNAIIIKMGYATPMTIPPNVKYADLFEELYEEAREQKKGLWKEEPQEKLVACTMEAKICPDRSAVGRTGPNCEFKACPE